MPDLATKPLANEVAIYVKNVDCDADVVPKAVETTSHAHLPEMHAALGSVSEQSGSAAQFDDRQVLPVLDIAHRRPEVGAWPIQQPY